MTAPAQDAADIERTRQSHLPWHDLFDILPAIAAIWLSVRVLRGFAARMLYPFDLEWMEGGMLAHAWRLSRGLPLFVEPSPDWVPYVYPPGYPWLLSVLSSVVILGYPLGRALSIGSTLATCVAIVILLGRRGSYPVGAIVAACWLGCWRAAGGFYDLVRPDSLGTALLAWSLAVGMMRMRRAAEISGLLLALAFTVKHHSAAFGFPLVAIFWLRDGRASAVRFALFSAVPAGLFTLAMQWATDGHFLDYLIAVPSSHPMDVPRMWPGVPGELGNWLLPLMVLPTGWLLAELGVQRPSVPAPALYALPALLGIGLAAAAIYKPEVRGVDMPSVAVLAISAGCIGAGAGAGLSMLSTSAMREESVSTVRFWGPFSLGSTALVVAVLMRGHYGGFLNVLIPAHLAICLGLGWAILEMRKMYPSAAIRGVTALLLLLCPIWISVRLDVDSILPDDADRAAGEAVIEQLMMCPPGPILSPYAAWMPVQAGREPSPHLIAMWDIDHARGPFRASKETFIQAARDHRWPCVLHGGRTPLGFGVEQNYRQYKKVPLPAKALMPKTGWRVRPETVLVPR